MSWRRLHPMALSLVAATAVALALPVRAQSANAGEKPAASPTEAGNGDAKTKRDDEAAEKKTEDNGGAQGLLPTPSDSEAAAGMTTAEPPPAPKGGTLEERKEAAELVDGDDSKDSEADEDASDVDGNNLALPPLKRVEDTSAPGVTIGTANVVVDAPKPDEERQLSSYLVRFVGKKATAKNLAAIEQWLLKLNRYRAAVCRFTGRGKARNVRCGVTRAPTIRSVALEGLPATLLEADVMRRVFLRPGEILDDKDERGKSRIARQEERLERYLEQKGLYGTRVRVLSPPVSKTSEIDVVIRVTGGSFVGVRAVLAQSPLPFDRNHIINVFNSMCAGDGLLEGFETLHINCYTKGRTRDVVDAMEAELRSLGYPEGRVRVKPRFVGIDDDPRDGIVERAKRAGRALIAKPGVGDSLPFVVKSKPRTNGDDEKNENEKSGDGKKKNTANAQEGSQTPSALLKEARENLNVPGVVDTSSPEAEKLNLPMTESCRPLDPARGREKKIPRCVDLIVDVVPGPHLVSTIDIVGRQRTNPYTTDPFAALNPSLSGIKDVFAASARIFRGAMVAPSRAVQLATGRPLASAADTQVEIEDLKDALTFDDSRSTDQTEAYVSAQSLRFALQKRGYFFAGVSVTHRGEKDRVDVAFEVDLGDPVAVHRIAFHGNESFSEEEIRSALDFAARPRSPAVSGFVTQIDLEGDRRRLLNFYEERGFVEANVEVDAERVDEDRIVVHYRVTEGSRWFVADILLEGVPGGLVDDIVQTLEHCKGGRAAEENRKPIVPADCIGSPFRPNDDDALALERQRVLNVFVAEGFPYATAEIAPVDFKAGGGVVLKISVHPNGERTDASIALTDAKGRPNLDAGGSGRGGKETPNGKNGKGESGDSDEADDDEADDDMVNLPDAESDSAEGRVRLGEIFIDGNTISQRNIMLRELAIRDDKVLRPKKIAEGVSRLRRTGLYSRVELDFIGIEEKSDRVHLLIQVEERPTVTVDTSLGFSTDRLFGWRLEARDRNFYGTMFDVSGLLDFGLFIGRYTQAQVQVRWPRILGSRVDLRVTPSFVYEDRPSTDIPRAPKDDTPQLAVGVWTVDQFRRRQARVGQVLGVEYQPLQKSDVLTLSLDFEQRLEWTDNLAKPLTPFSLEALQTVDGMTLAFDQCVLPVSTVTPKVTLRDLDNPFDPKQGYRLEGSVMLGHPILGVSCDRSGPVNIGDLDVIGEWVGLLSASATGYYTIGRFTFAGNVRGWTGVARSDDRFFQSSLIRNQSLLAVGGDRSVRGYDQDDIGLKAYGTRPDEGIAVFDENNLLSLTGGVLNLEVRTTLVPNFFVGDLNGAAFVDVGMVTDTLNLPWLAPRQFWDQLSTPSATYVDPRLGVGVGLGLRYVLPVGPISADFAVRPDPVIDALFGLTPRTPAFDVHFQLGYVF